MSFFLDETLVKTVSDQIPSFVLGSVRGTVGRVVTSILTRDNPGSNPEIGNFI